MENKINKLHNEICSKCENQKPFLWQAKCENCPVWSLVVLAKNKVKTVIKHDDWFTPPSVKPEMN